jgi:hypothetical protein
VCQGETEPTFQEHSITEISGAEELRKIAKLEKAKEAN